VNIAVN